MQSPTFGVSLLVWASHTHIVGFWKSSRCCKQSNDKHHRAEVELATVAHNTCALCSPLWLQATGKYVATSNPHKDDISPVAHYTISEFSVMVVTWDRPPQL